MQKTKIFISSLGINDVKLTTHNEYYLDTDDLIIYKIYLPNLIKIKSEFVMFLNASELNRADRFHKDIDRNRFIIYRSILKIVLAAYTKLDVKNIYLDYHENKKPYLTSHPWLHFNLSHSEDYAVIAISGKEVGIDIEYIAEDFNFTQILSDIFDYQEILNIENAIDNNQSLYTSWTRKEAISKALGKGIDDDFKYIPCLDGTHNIDSNLLKNNKNWSVYSFDFDYHYSGAVCFQDLTRISKNLKVFTVPNTLKELQETIPFKY